MCEDSQPVAVAASSEPTMSPGDGNVFYAQDIDLIPIDAADRSWPIGGSEHGDARFMQSAAVAASSEPMRAYCHCCSAFRSRCPPTMTSGHAVVAPGYSLAMLSALRMMEMVRRAKRDQASDRNCAGPVAHRARGVDLETGRSGINGQPAEGSGSAASNSGTGAGGQPAGACRSWRRYAASGCAPSSR